MDVNSSFTCFYRLIYSSCSECLSSARTHASSSARGMSVDASINQLINDASFNAGSNVSQELSQFRKLIAVTSNDVSNAQQKSLAKNKSVKQKYLLACHPNETKINVWRCAHYSGYYEKLYIWTLKFHKVAQKQTWGEVVWLFQLLHFILERNDKKIFNRFIFASVIVEIKVARFMWSTV